MPIYGTYGESGIWSPTQSPGDTGSTLTDQTVGGNDGTLSGGVAFVEENTRINERYRGQGRALSFDGSGLVTLPAKTWASGPFSIALWANPASVTNAYLLGKVATDTEDFVRITSATGVAINIAGILATFDVLTLAPDEWVPIVFTRSAAGNVAAYVNGSASTTPPISAAGSLTVDQIGIAGASTYFSGKQDDLRFFDHELTAEEVSMLSFRGRGWQRA